MAASAGDPGEGLAAPLVHKKAGIRDAGFIFVGRKSWWAGLVLVVVSCCVLAVTVLTAILGD